MPRCTLLILTCAVLLNAADAPPPPRVFDAAQIQASYRILLDRGALMLEAIKDVIKLKGIADGQVLITAGSVSECTYHYVADTAAKPTDLFKTVRGPFEILGGGGIIADGEPHIHITLADAQKGAFGGHLENGCKILYLGEITIMKYAGPALTRKKNQNGVSLLTKK